MTMLQNLITPRRHRSVFAGDGKDRPIDPASALIRALLELGRGQAQLLFHEGHDWQSATFEGMRHSLALEFTGEAAIARGRHIAAMLAEHEFDLNRHIVVDIAVSKSNEQRRSDPPVLQLDITALTVEDI
jgi:hypothetical protein